MMWESEAPRERAALTKCLLYRDCASPSFHTAKTHLRSGGCIAAVETMSILAAGEEPSPATQRITPRAFALPVQSNGLLRQEIVD